MLEEVPADLLLQDFGLSAIAGAVSGIGILDRNSEIILGGQVVMVDYMLTCRTDQFGALQYGSGITVGGVSYTVRHEPLKLADGLYCSIPLERVEAEVVINPTGSSVATFSIVVASTGAVAVLGESSYVLEITGFATGGDGSTVLGGSSATLAITGLAAGSVLVSGVTIQPLVIGGTTGGAVSITGASSQAFNVTGPASGVIGAVAIGNSSATLAITGAATGSVLATGNSSAALSLTGSATGLALVSGTSSAALSITGVATGTAEDVGTGDYITTLSGDRLVTLSGDRLIILPVSGSIAGASTQTLALAGSATAAVRVAGLSSQVMALIGVSAGAVGIAGVSSGVLAITGVITGAVQASGASAGTLAIAGAAAATIRVTGSSGQTLAITGSAAGTVAATGASAGTLAIAGAAAATVRVSGVSTQTLAITGSAAGTAGGSGFPAPTMYLPLVDDLLDDSANGFTYTGTPTPINLTSTPPPIASSYYSFVFDGGDALIFADTALLNPGTGDFTISAFVRPTFATGMADYPAWFSKGAYQSSTGAMVAFRDRIGDGRWGIGFSNPWRETPTAGAASVSDTWVRLTFVRSGNTITLYQGTSVRGTVDATGLDLTSTHVFVVGGSLGGGTDNWQGGICDFAYIRGTALTTDQISDLQTSTYGALL